MADEEGDAWEDEWRSTNPDVSSTMVSDELPWDSEEVIMLPDGEESVLDQWMEADPSTYTGSGSRLPDYDSEEDFGHNSDKKGFRWETDAGSDDGSVLEQVTSLEPDDLLPETTTPTTEEEEQISTAVAVAKKQPSRGTTRSGGRSDSIVRRRIGRWHRIVKEAPSESEDTPEDDQVMLGDAGTEEDDDTAVYWPSLDTRSQQQLTEYWTVQKLTAYLRESPPSFTIMCLNLLASCDLRSDITLLALMHSKAFEVFINLLDTSVHECLASALHILEMLAADSRCRRLLVKLGLVQSLCRLLRDSHCSINTGAARVIASSCKTSYAMRQARKGGALETMVCYLELSGAILSTPWKHLSSDNRRLLDRAVAALDALRELARSRRNRQALLRANIQSCLGAYLRCAHPPVHVPVLGLVRELVREPLFMYSVVDERIVENLVQFLRKEGRVEKVHVAAALYHGSEDKRTRNAVRYCDGLRPLLQIIADPQYAADNELLTFATCAIWKLLKSPENVYKLRAMNVIEVLVPLLHGSQFDEVEVGVAGALTEIARVPEYRRTIRRAAAIPKLAHLEQGFNPQLLANAAEALGVLSNDKECVEEVDIHGGIECTWSLLKHEKGRVKATAAFALCPMLENVMDSGEVVRSIVGAMELVVKVLTTSTEHSVLAGCCALLSRIARDPENVHILTDMGAVAALVALSQTRNCLLQQHLCDAIADMCNLPDNCRTFGENGVLEPMVSVLDMSLTPVVTSEGVSRLHLYEPLVTAVTCALSRLCQDPLNCVRAHWLGATNIMLEFSDSKIPLKQAAAATCLARLRKAAAAASNHCLRSPVVSFPRQKYKKVPRWKPEQMRTEICYKMPRRKIAKMRVAETPPAMRQINVAVS